MAWPGFFLLGAKSERSEWLMGSSVERGGMGEKSLGLGQKGVRKNSDYEGCMGIGNCVMSVDKVIVKRTAVTPSNSLVI